MSVTRREQGFCPATVMLVTTSVTNIDVARYSKFEVLTLSVFESQLGWFTGFNIFSREHPSSEESPLETYIKHLSGLF